MSVGEAVSTERTLILLLIISRVRSEEISRPFSSWSVLSVIYTLLRILWMKETCCGSEMSKVVKDTKVLIVDHNEKAQIIRIM